MKERKRERERERGCTTRARKRDDRDSNEDRVYMLCTFSSYFYIKEYYKQADDRELLYLYTASCEQH
jgi:hypothetical protein